jgi:hypothetical protein
MDTTHDSAALQDAEAGALDMEFGDADASVDSNTGPAGLGDVPTSPPDSTPEPPI